MTAALLHTLVWTGVLIAAVLILRRPVTRHFGPQVAYALWALPLARLILPPLTLPAWMAPSRPDAVPDSVAADVLVLEPVPAPSAAADPGGFDLLATLADWPILETLLLIWLGGAMLTLALRFGAYFTLRDDVLAEGREVGRAEGGFGGLLGKVRLVETPATAAPLAMGVLDPVIALPPGFMALPDRTARDLALAHELAHHRGGDLLVNMIVQPLFALHWFNPLGRYGWLALRRDQEAACDARVMARRTPQERATYATLIAGFAAAPGATGHAALAAPMACPVLGETSIIHRLRSLSMSDPTPPRRLAGRALLGAGLLALPLTASISYAASEAQVEAPEPPAPPEAPAAPAAPDAPTPPQPPEAPEAPEAEDDVAVFVIKRMARPDDDAAAEAGEEGRDQEQVTEQVWREKDGKERRFRMVLRSSGDGAGALDPAQRDAMIAELRAELAEGVRLPPDLPRALAEARADVLTLRAAPNVMVMKECTSAFEGQAQIINGKDGKKTIMICQPRMPMAARLGLEQARAEIASDKSIPEDTRKQVLETLDRQIARWKEKGG
ncbi:hypothetical protein CHX26_11785 [Porphyrobacter sp. HT-58-2]|uniref:M56 family metallopeptidase n=1 Tax=Porphyrobacter sp. HT-58-2 TaxID=2023229 RepID=UPI000CDBBD76|nr:M56 family metallopeptidase [Porphyrobacter sp. HT-58-2]AUX70077.1 hypothetical protein CHX26_11785 [Porphyrobacter sp. HT-58-2]